MYWVYILKSKKTERYYTGYTLDLNRRLADHNSGKNVSTKPGIPWEIIYSENFKDKKSAWLRERQIKKYKGGKALKNLIK